jgi:hypothetical protein
MRLLISLLFGMSIPTFLTAQDTTAMIQVEQAVVGTGVTDRAPQGVASQFAADVGRLWCFTHIAGASAGTQITHVWFYRDQEMARVPLTIGGPNWRTWTRKNVQPEWTGQWRVEIQAQGGTVLETVTFTIQ